MADYAYPFLGSAYTAKTKNLADQKCINLFPSLVDGAKAKDVGAFYTTPGLTLATTTGTLACRGLLPFFDILYAVSGNQVYSITTGYVATFLGTIGTNAGPVSMINNLTQVAIFDGVNGYLISGGTPLTGGIVGNGGSLYAVDDTIDLQAIGGDQIATAQITVTTVVSGVVTGFVVDIGGSFTSPPTSFIQATTSGSGTGFVLTSPTFGAATGLYQISLPFSGPVSADYQDGFGIVNVKGTNLWYQSNLNDLSIWGPLNFSSADAQPDNIIAIADIHRQAFLLGDVGTEVWVNAGLPGFAFQRLDGVYIELGIASPFSIANAGESICWLSKDTQGQGIVVTASGYEPRRVSTHAIEGAIASYPTISDAVAYAYQQSGHLFYVITFPSGNATWCVDLSVEPPMWHQRAAFSNGQFSRERANCYAFFNGKHIVGDYQNGNIYFLDEAAKTDNGAVRKWVRSWRALEKAVFEPVTFSSLQIDMQTGIGVPDGTNPLVVLRHSDDGGHSWSNERFVSAGKTGETALRVMFRRLGSTRLNSGLDRIFELSSTDVWSVGLIGADLT